MSKLPRFMSLAILFCRFNPAALSQIGALGAASVTGDGLTSADQRHSSRSHLDGGCHVSNLSALTRRESQSSLGDAVYRRDRAPATIRDVQSSCPVVTPSLFSVKYQAYIPVDNLAGPTPCVTRSLHQNAGGLTYLGDDSLFSPTGYRVQQADVLTTYPAAAVPQPMPVPFRGKTVNFHTPTFIGYNPLPPITRAQFQEPDPFSMIADPGTLLNPTYPWEYGCNGVLENLWGFADISMMTGNAYSSPNFAHLELIGIANDPLEFKLGGINWDINVNITPNRNSVTITGWHTCYPAHQITINGVKVYSYQPAQNATTYLLRCLTAANSGTLNPGNIQVNCTVQLNTATPCKTGAPQPSVVTSSVTLTRFGQAIGGANEFDRFFAMVAADVPAPVPSTQAAFDRLADSIQTLSPSALSSGISVIDGQLDSPYTPAKLKAKLYAEILLDLVTLRPDFTDFLVPEIPRLSALVLGTEPTMSPGALSVLMSIGYQKPDLVTPVLIAALKTKNAVVIGPKAAVTLLRIAPATDEEVKAIVEFLRRADIPAKAQIDTVIWIASSPVIPDPVAEEMVRFLDSPYEPLRNRALVAISRSSPQAQEKARPRLTQMANDPHETPRTRRIVAEALRGEVRSDPDSEK